MRAIVKLMGVSAVIAICAVDSRVEFAIAGAVLLAIVAYGIYRLDRKPAVAAAPFDHEGRTVRAPLTAKEAAELHARYALTFDQQAAILRHQERHGIERYEPMAGDHPDFDQSRYQRAQSYARAFDAQLAARRMTRSYEVPTPNYAIARGSYTDGQYRRMTRSQPPVEPVIEPWVKPTTRRS
jgi:hypothetical protein